MKKVCAKMYQKNLPDFSQKTNNITWAHSVLTRSYPLWLFSQNWKVYQKNHFQSGEGIHKKTAVLLTALSQNIRRCFEACMAHMEQCRNGNYFEGDDT
jgi:hypothetical protein